MKVVTRLVSLARDSRFALAGTVLSGLLIGLLTIWQAACLSRVVDQVFLGGKLLSDVAGILRLLFLIICLRALLAWGSEISANVVALHVKSDLRQRLFNKFLSLGPAYTRGERTGELVNAAVEGVETLDAYFSQYLPQLFIAALVPLSILIAVFPRDPLSGFVLLLTAPLIPVFMFLIGKTAETLTKRQWDTLSLLSAHFLDSLQGLTTLKELGRSKDRADSISEASNRFRDVTLSVLRITFLSALVLEMVATVSTAVVAVEVSLRLLYGQLAFQQAFFLLLLAPEFYIPLRMLGLRFHAGMTGATAARRIFEILDTPVSGDQGPWTGIQYSHPTIKPVSHIAFEQVSYIYPGETLPALRDITLEIHPGEHVALVGMSGAGKSTLAALLLRFILPGSGQIIINNEPISGIPVDTWRDQVAWVPQNPYLFHDTISANLHMARPEASEEHLETAVQAAHLDQFVHSLPQGYGTVVGEEGARLSAGQAQRLSLARAFLKNAPILILDEPTSCLDPEQEMQVESSIQDLMRGRTVISIAHRLNTIYQADRIFVLDQGSLVEVGTHSELMAKGGFYSRLVGTAGQMGDMTAKSKEFKAKVEIGTSNPAGSIVDAQKIVHRTSSIFRLLGFLNGSWGWVALSVLLGALTVASNVGLMGTAAFLITSAAMHPELGTLQVAIAGVRFFGIMRGVFRYAERLISHSVTFRLLARLRIWFYRALEPLAPARLMQYRSGDLLSRIAADVETLENFYVRVVAPFLVATIVAVGMVMFFGRYNLHLAWIYLLFLLILGIGVPLLSWTVSHRAGTELVSQRAALQARLVDGIQGLADILVFGRGHDYAVSLSADGKTYGQTQLVLGSLYGFSSGLTTLLVNSGMLATLVISIPLITARQLPGIMLAVLVLSALAGFEAVIPLPLAAQTLSSSLQAARRLFEVVDTEPIVRDLSPLDNYSLAKTSTINHELRVSDLRFTYPGQPQPALQHINFQLPPGKRIAIVGPSGAGKSTLACLLLRFWDYSQGRIFLDGHDLHEYSQEDVRRLVSFISQRTYYFNDTIRNNLLLAKPNATEDEIQNAAKQAQIHEFIFGLPQRYETIIGERGFRLSSGERQRLAIARAFLKNAPIYLLDEPTANLDPINELHFLDMLFSLTCGQSLLLITHRLVKLENMDEILVLDQGHLVERGTHKGLAAAEGFYHQLLDLQNRILVDPPVA